LRHPEYAASSLQLRIFSGWSVSIWLFFRFGSDQKAGETAFGKQLTAGIKLKTVFTRVWKNDVIEMQSISDNLPNIGELNTAPAFDNNLLILLDIHEFYGKVHLAVAVGQLEEKGHTRMPSGIFNGADAVDYVDDARRFRCRVYYYAVTDYRRENERSNLGHFSVLPCN
jgi:hypothetical protein